MALNLTRVHPKLKTIARNLPKVAASQGLEVRITSGFRTRAVQAKLYRDYITGVSAYPANPPGQSAHEKGLALDILTTDVNKLVSILSSVGLVWAGMGDPIHFEIPSKTALGGSVGQKVPVAKAPAKAKKSVAAKVISAASWVPGPVGWAATVLDFLL